MSYVLVKTAMEKEQVRERERSRRKTENAVRSGATVHEKKEFLLGPLPSPAPNAKSTASLKTYHSVRLSRAKHQDRGLAFR